MFCIDLNSIIKSNWILGCKFFQQNFDKWTSKNEFIDKFIKEVQSKAKKKCLILEWIPYNRFENIEYLDKGGFSIVYKAIWLDGPIKKWSKNEKKWIRLNNQIVVLKSLNKSSSLNEEFLNEVWNQINIYS